MTGPALRAVIYLRRSDDHGCLRRCESHCARHGYRVVGVVVDPDASRWAEVVLAAFAGEFEILVYCPEDLVPGRVPRMEAAEPPDDPPITVRHRRPRRP